MIRRLEPEDYRSWEALWKQYLVFYESELPEEHTALLWRRLLDEGDEVECFVATDGMGLTGFTHYLPHANTWADRPICYLQDLYVATAARGRGVGGELIEAVRATARSRGWGPVYWQTAEDNDRARILYDRMAGGASGFLVYEIDVAE